jgi:hypothetical protein
LNLIIDVHLSKMLESHTIQTSVVINGDLSFFDAF